MTILRLILIAALAGPAFGAVSVKRTLADAKKLNVNITGESLLVATNALAFYIPEPIEFAAGAERVVTYRGRGLDPVVALQAIVEKAGLRLTLENGTYWIGDRVSSTVTLDVKDGDIRAILKTMQRQCGIKNLILDKDVQGEGTFLFYELPCRTAFDVVFRSMGLSSVTYSPQMISVGKSRG